MRTVEMKKTLCIVGFILLLAPVTNSAWSGYVRHRIPSPGPYPEGLAWDGTNLWNADFATSTIYKLDPIDGTVVDSFPSPQVQPNGLTYDGSALWLAVDSGDNTIYKINPSTGDVIGTFDSPSEYPQGLAWDGRYLLHSDIFAMSIYTLDPDTGSIISSIYAPDAQPYGLAWDGTHVWNVDFGTDRIFKLDPLTGMVLEILPAPGKEPRGLTWDGSYLWCTDNATGSIYQLDVDVETGSIAGYVREYATGNPLLDAFVMAIQKPTKVWLLTMPDGYYEMAFLPEGFWWVLAYKQGYKLGFSWAYVEPDQIFSRDFELIPK